jgi:Na+-translocating ferredoxin:NAD+ oxidoreductase subunit G
MTDDDLRQELSSVLFLTIVVCISVISLTLINSITESRIEEAKQEAIDELLGEQFPDMAYSEYDDSIEVYTIFSTNDSVMGYAFLSEGKGYGGAIDILVALENTSMEQDQIILKSVSIVAHSETPGLGAKIEDIAFLEQFTGLSVQDVKLSSDGGRIDAISGATISSSAMVDAVYDDALAKAGKIQNRMAEESAQEEV